MLHLVVAALALTPIPAPPPPGEDWQVLTEAENDVIFWIDRDSIRDVGPYKQIRTKSDYSRVTWGDVGARIAVEDVDCAKRATRPRSTIAYRRDGTVLRTMNLTEAEAQWKAVQPDSIGEAKVEAACGVQH